MHHGYTTPLVIAIMAFAVVSFLFLIDTSINPDGSSKPTNAVTVRKDTNNVACTMEAKQCPDGSYVGRSGPKCEFAECSATNTNAEAQKESTDEVDPGNKNVRIYTSYKLGIRFHYWSSSDNRNNVLEKDARIYVYYINADGSSKPTDGQWVEHFSKTPTTSLSDAITERFLDGYSPNDCYVKTATGTKPSGWDFSVISFPRGNDMNNDWIANAAKCPAPYTASNWIGYFGIDQKNQRVFYFFSIGQYVIPGTGLDTPWQETVETVSS